MDFTMTKTNGSHPVRISGLTYILGEGEGRYSDLPETASVIESHNMTGGAKSWGFGTYRKTHDSYFEFITKAGQKALAASGHKPEEVDAVYLCSATFQFDFETMNLSIGQLMRDLNIVNAVPSVVSGTGCVALVLGMIMARRAIMAGEAKTILLLATDIVKDGYVRFYQYATISDAASALVMSSTGNGQLEVISSSLNSSASLMLKDDQYVAGQKALYGDAAAELFDETGIKVDEVKKVLASNLHLPIQRIFAVASGFQSNQVFTENVDKLGHCYGSDPIINFLDYANQNKPKSGDVFVLQSSAMGHVGNLLVRAV
jgi:3-oxoacyl-[acyl-carrier-protein] synthase III